MNYQENDQDKFQEQLKKFIAALKQEIINSDIIPFQKQLFSYLNKQVKQQEARLKQYVKPEGSDDSSHETNLRQLIYKCQTEKVGYLLKEYLRVRIKKIEKYCFSLYKNQNVAQKKLSESEYVFMKKYAEMKYKYYEENVLKNIVKPYRGFGGLETFFAKTKQTALQIDTKQSRIQIPEPKPDEYLYCQITGNPDLYRFSSDIPVSNVQQNSIIPVNSIIFTHYFMMEMQYLSDEMRYHEIFYADRSH